ncbi:endonuclease/exonuclease/phosphatase family protein [Marinoscillum pacificum]|uniref:endonuclease/exonuclease/phosphatase family protein n=1 Tax=Marinoscillum pacificum TaxID=392723 RepID=UPI0021571667|nr:endonuclease/exonuclease/phosphatase family protein [Marinoscillum pacificum]
MRLLTTALFLLLITVSSFAQELKVMTYNIRLDHAGDNENNWHHRKDELVSQIKFYEPGVFGVQEALPQQLDYMDENLADYAYIGVGRDDGKRAGEFSAVFYKKTEFKLIEGSTFWLSDTPEKVSKGWDAALPRICTYGLFERISDGQKFWFFNTHFDHIGVEARVESMKLILAQIKKKNKKDYPVVLTGDLNVTPDEGPITELKKVLKDSREAANLAFGPDATFNGFNFTQAPQKRIDYIAVSEDIKVSKYAVLTDSFDQKYISDHFPVFCILSLE